MSKPKIKLSASKIDTLLSCSWLYYCKYILKLPDLSGTAASLGSTCHIVFEVLMNPRHKKHYDDIIKANDIQGSVAVNKLVNKWLTKLNINTSRMYEMANEYILAGLKCDFFCLGSTNKRAETEFKLEFENFVLNGFIDVLATYDDKMLVRDYKSSKSKFSGDKLEGNLQAIIYSIAVRHEYKLIPYVQFIFLKFGRKPVLSPSERYSDQELNGALHYFSYVADRASRFTEADAQSYFASDGGFASSWKCGKEGVEEDGLPKFICSFKQPFDYYVLLNDKKEVISSSREPIKPKEGHTVEPRRYEGCPRFN
jgi:hypothetical protein